MKKKLITLLFITALLLILTNYIFYPAHISTTVACRPQVFEEKYSDTYYIAGQTTIDTETQEIEIELITADKKTLKHELIHYNQFENRKILTCSYFGSRIFLREVEAYTGQYYPDFMFNLLYL